MKFEDMGIPDDVLKELDRIMVNDSERPKLLLSAVENYVAKHDGKGHHEALDIRARGEYYSLMASPYA